MRFLGGPFKPAVHGVVLLTIGLCIVGTRCPVQGPLYVDDFCWTSFEGIPASQEQPLRIGSFELKNVTDDDVGVFLQPLQFPLTYGENNNSFVIPPKTKYMVDVWTQQSPSQQLVDDFTWFRGSALPFRQHNVEVQKFLAGGHGSRATTFKVPVMGTLRPNSVLDGVRSIGDTLAGKGYGDMLANNTYGLELGKKRPNSNPFIIRRIPVSYIEEIGVVDDSVILDPQFAFQAQFKGNGAAFPCGQSKNGFTVCPNMPAALPSEETEYVAVFQVLDADIPLDDPETFLTYSVVFETDDDDSNDWVPLPEFRLDFFRGTDLWYQAQYSPVTGAWTLVVQRVTDAENNVATEITSSARAVIQGNTICFLIPVSELGSAVPEYRITSFGHEGDFGQNFPFTYRTDFFPGLDELMTVESQVAEEE